MSINRANVRIECSQCEFASSAGAGSFDVIVPVNDAATGIAGLAELHCTVGADLHTVELTEWRNDQGQIIEPSEDLRHRLTDTLGFVAERRVCGNRHLCPTEVVRVVKEVEAT